MKPILKTTPERSKLMSKIHSKNGKAESLLAKTLWNEGIRYRRNFKFLPGSPDIAITKYKIAIFIDGEFWHGYNWENKKPHIKNNREYWIKKIESNMARDKRNNDDLFFMDWYVIRFWSNEVLHNINFCLNSIQTAIDIRK